MRNRQQHWQEIRDYLHAHIAPCEWTFTLPSGSGHETYFVHGGGRRYFVKIGASTRKYEVLASEGLTPEVVLAGYLEDGASIVVQRYLAGKNPSRQDYQQHLDSVALIMRRMHHAPRLQHLLPAVSFDSYRDAAAHALTDLKGRWALYRVSVSAEAAFVDESLDRIGRNIAQMDGSGLVASHNDICNANWILTEDDRFYLVDLEAMALDDPARDLGALLWWYYPPEMRGRFLRIAGYTDDQAFRFRMQVRMAMHCLHIILPRDNSFDSFNPSAFGAALTDFKAILAGEENPQGYD